EAVAAADIVIGNEEEVAASRVTAVPTLVLKRGERGATVYDGGEETDVPGFPIDVVNGLGAGDAFAAALGHGLLHGLPLVEAEGERWELGGRPSVFDGLPWALYLPREPTYSVEGDGELAICGARCERRREPVLVRPEDVEVEVRGAGNATRQINHIVKPEFPAERLLVVEVFTPSGNWSSYPPHKHDEDNAPGEVVLEETYYY